MTELLLDTPLAANLEALGGRNADLARRIRETPPASDVTFIESTQGPLIATRGGRQLASRHRPLDEARRLVDEIDVVENAVIVILGFGLGYHVQRLAERLDRTGLIVVFEPDLALLRAVLERVDHSAWLARALVVFATDADDRGELARALHGADSIVAQGVTVLEHPASRERLGDQATRFAGLFGELVSAVRTTMATTLVRAAETVANQLGNIDHYATGPGVEELAGVAAGATGIVVSAGPSLRKNIDRLAAPGVRDRCVIVAVQTTLKPLLEAGVRPHFVTALDYHEISSRFYESLTPADVEGVTLVADSKAHPVILDAFPGPVRCCRSPFLDRVLGEHARPMGDLPPGATVAHLALYLARHLGCNPIALIGQDLGFSDGLYYAPGTAIDSVWAPELNPFNTIEMMQWQRIVRHRNHLHRTVDCHGRPIFTDAQMMTYLHQFERDFAELKKAGVRIIDATEGGVAKQHVETATLGDVLEGCVATPIPALPAPAEPDARRREPCRRHIASLRHDVKTLRDTSRKTTPLLERMLADQSDAAAMRGHFEKLERLRKDVGKRMEAFDLLSQLNQLGVYKRQKADRRLHLADADDATARQHAQLERDLENVRWIADAADEFIGQLIDAEKVLAGGLQSPGSLQSPVSSLQPPSAGLETATRIAALIPVDPERNGLGIARDLTASFDGRPVIQHTLERLGRCGSLASIVLITPRDFDVESLIDRGRIGRPVEIEHVDGSPFPAEQRVIAAARAWTPTCWRGGVAGMSVFDEVLCPQVMSRICDERGLEAVLLAAPDWPLLDVTPESGCEAIIRRHLEHPDELKLVFTQAPPGLGGCVISAGLLREMSQRNRLATIGGLLVYQPHAPQGDPIARDANVQIDHGIRDAMLRGAFDTPAACRLLETAIATHPDLVTLSPAAVAKTLADTRATLDADATPHVVLELTTRRMSAGLFRHPDAVAGERPDLSVDAAKRILDGLAGCVLTLDGAGDPLLHEQFEQIVDAARDVGIEHVHVRTELRAPRQRIARLLATTVEVVSVDLHADRAETYRRMTGGDAFRDVLLDLEWMIEERARATGQPAAAALALPWIVPRLQRCSVTAADVESFFDRWQARLGTCVIEGRPAGDDDPLPAAVTPPAATRRMQRETRVFLCDGTEVTS